MPNQNPRNDGRSDLEIDLSDAEFMCIAKMAHERDITFNKMVETILWNYINDTKRKIPTLTDVVDTNE
jgi:hypothetical protein